MARLLTLTVALILIAVGAFMLMPSPIDSLAWTPPPAPPLQGPTAPNERLDKAALIAQGKIVGPETTAMDAKGVLYAGLQNGHIVRILPDGTVKDWVNTGGRPLGMVFDAQGNLIVCDAWKGLLSISPRGLVEVLANTADGRRFGFTDDVDIAPDGRIYFTDASYRWHQPDYEMDLLESRPYGRLLRYDPKTHKLDVLMRDLYFANGVAVSKNGDFVLVNETWRYRIRRYWIRGPKAGQSELFADNLPGFPDGIARDDSGRFWVALPTRRNAQMDSLYPNPWLKNLVAKLPESLRPQPQPYGFVLAFDAAGHLLTSLQDTTGAHLKEITSVVPHDGMLYFGSLHNDRIGRLPLAGIPGLEQNAVKTGDTNGHTPGHA